MEIMWSDALSEFDESQVPVSSAVQGSVPVLGDPSLWGFALMRSGKVLTPAGRLSFHGRLKQNQLKELSRNISRGCKTFVRRTLRTSRATAKGEMR